MLRLADVIFISSAANLGLHFQMATEEYCDGFAQGGQTGKIPILKDNYPVHDDLENVKDAGNSEVIILTKQKGHSSAELNA